MIGRLNHVAIAVPDLEAAAAQYLDEEASDTAAAVWFYVDDAHTKHGGPVNRSALLELWRAGDVHASTLVWKAPMAGWEAFGSLTELRSEAVFSRPTATTTAGAPRMQTRPAILSRRRRACRAASD